MGGNHAPQTNLDQLPEGAGGEEADLHTLVPDSALRQAESPGRLRDALEARAASLKYSADLVFSRLLAHCFIRSGLPFNFVWEAEMAVRLNSTCAHASPSPTLKPCFLSAGSAETTLIWQLHCSR
jgi:hypothetical protein